MPLRKRGIHVDWEGSGISYYHHRSPGDPGRSKQDELEREQTIIALYSGIDSQKKFFPDCQLDEAWALDKAIIRLLLEEMQPARPATCSADLHARAEKLVADNWSTIDGLASTLLAKGNTAMPAIEVHEGWSRGKKGTEKFMSASEIAAFFESLGIEVLILPD
jgi:hypothetical protein